MNRMTRRELLGGALAVGVAFAGRRSPGSAETRASSEIPNRFTVLDMAPSGDALSGMVDYGVSQHIAQAGFSPNTPAILREVALLPFKARAFAASPTQGDLFVAAGGQLWVKRNQQPGEAISHAGGEIQFVEISPDNKYAFFVRKDSSGRQHLARLDMKAERLAPQDVSVPTAESLGFSSMSQVLYDQAQGSYTFYAGDGDPQNGFMQITHFPAENRSQVLQIQLGSVEQVRNSLLSGQNVKLSEASGLKALRLTDADVRSAQAGSLEPLSIHPLQTGGGANEVWIVTRSRRIVRVANGHLAGQIELAADYGRPNDPEDPTLRAITQSRITMNTLFLDEKNDLAYIGIVQTVYYFDASGRLTARHTPKVEAVSIPEPGNQQKRTIMHSRGGPRFGVTWNIAVISTGDRTLMVRDNLQTQDDGSPGQYDGFYASDISNGIGRAGDWVRITSRVKTLLPFTSNPRR